MRHYIEGARKSINETLLGKLIGLTLASTMATFGYVYYIKYSSDEEINRPFNTEAIPREVELPYQLQVADLNNNGIPERFYTIDDKVALIELDGKPVTELLKR